MPDKTSAQPRIVPVILSGGSGTRLWPMSREDHPKQLLPLVTDFTLLQDTAGRIADTAMFGPPLVICNSAHRFVIGEQLRAIDVAPRHIVLEPVGRNTAPAVAAAALMLARTEPTAMMLVLPSDHAITDPAAFHDAVATAAAAAADGVLVTFGIEPDRPHTGYGYIQLGAAMKDCPGCHYVDGFVEKPDEATAAAYLADGGYTWNSGIFLFTAESYLEELARLEPEMLEGCREAVSGAENDLDFVRLAPAPFEALEGRSIDYAVMEHTRRATVVPVDMGWSDLGSWDALWQIGKRDPAGNVISGDVHLHDVANAYVRSEGPLVAALGVGDLVIVATSDVVLVLPRDRSEEVRTLVEELSDNERPEAAQHLTVYRPWGYYQSIHDGERFQVKRITVNPGAKLSLQKHHHRAEHWVVVNGVAEVTRGDETFILNENESTYISPTTVHRLANPGKTPLNLIEVQSGSYLGEDDIVRLEDSYGRN